MKVLVGRHTIRHFLAGKLVESVCEGASWAAVPSAISLAGKLVKSVCEGVSWAAYHLPFLLQANWLRVCVKVLVGQHTIRHFSCR